VQASDHRASHRHDLVREPVDDLACLGVTGSGRAEYHRRELADLAIPDPARVEGLSHRRRRLQAPMGRHVLLQGRAGATAVTSPDGSREPRPPDVGTPAPVSGDLPEGIEPGSLPVRGDAGRVHALTADHDDAPGSIRPGAQRPERIVEHELLRRKPSLLERRREEAHVGAGIRSGY